MFNENHVRSRDLSLNRNGWFKKSFEESRRKKKFFFFKYDSSFSNVNLHDIVVEYVRSYSTQNRLN